MQKRLCLALLSILVANVRSQEYVGDPIPVAPQPVTTEVPIPATEEFSNPVIISEAPFDGPVSSSASLSIEQPTDVIIESNRISTDVESISGESIEPIPDDGREHLGKCEPEWTDAKDIKFEGKTAAFFTHFTDRLDCEFKTRPALIKLVEFVKESNVPAFYLHEKAASSEQYFYDDCDPTAYLSSDIGHIDTDTSKLEHVVLSGGFYELCFNNTYTDIVRGWQNIREDKTLKITLVLDAIYGVASDSYTEDEFNQDLRAWIREQSHPTLLMSNLLKQLPNRNHAWTFLSRKWDTVPQDFGLHVSFRGELTAIRFAQEGYPTILLEYATTEEGFEFSRESEKPVVD